MSGKPSTGTPSTYVAGDQQNYGRDDIRREQKHHFINAEGYIPRERNKVMNEMLEEDIQEKIADRYKHDPTFAATMHGNQPSRGAKMDAQIQADEEAELRKKKERSASVAEKKPGDMVGRGSNSDDRQTASARDYEDINFQSTSVISISRIQIRRKLYRYLSYFSYLPRAPETLWAPIPVWFHLLQS